MYPHIVQVDVVLQIFWTTSTVRCPITMAVTLLVAAGLMLLPDTEHTSALHLSGSTPALRNDTIGEHSPLQHTLLGERSAICTKPKLQYPSDVWSLSWDALYCWVVTSPCTHPTKAVKQWLPKGRQHLGSYCCVRAENSTMPFFSSILGRKLGLAATPVLVPSANTHRCNTTSAQMHRGKIRSCFH